MQLVWTFIISTILTSPLYAATVTTVKGKNVVITLDGESVERGQKVELYDTSGKKRGIIQISKTNKNGTKAVGKLIVGKAQKGWLTDYGKDATIPTYTASNKKLSYGVLFSFSMDSMNVTPTGSSEVELSGTGYGVKGAFDFNLSERFQLRGRGGAEFFSASGDTTDISVCSPNQKCETDITYITLEGMAQYYLSRSKYSFWIGAGGAIAHPASSSSNAINTDSLSTTSAIQVGGGFDIKMQSGAYIPVEIVYSLLPESDSVSATYLSITLGYMW